MLSSQFLQRMSLRRNRIDDMQRYPFCLPAVRSLDQLDFHPKVTFFVAEGAAPACCAICWNAETKLAGLWSVPIATRSSHEAGIQAAGVAA